MGVGKQDCEGCDWLGAWSWGFVDGMAQHSTAYQYMDSSSMRTVPISRMAFFTLKGAVGYLDLIFNGKVRGMNSCFSSLAAEPCMRLFVRCMRVHVSLGDPPVITANLCPSHRREKLETRSHTGEVAAASVLHYRLKRYAHRLARKRV